ncbi:MAG: (deoxy)nucleoside triphosphate pyrophosphohydrolase [Kangiellaceae bacterium]
MSHSIKVVAAIISNNDKFLIAKRPNAKHQGGMWEFPGGKVESNESNITALYRECLEELDIRIAEPEHFDHIDFDYGDKKVSITFYRVFNFSGVAKGNEGQEIIWATLCELKEKILLKANKRIVNKLLKIG